MTALTNKLELQRFLGKNFYCHRTRVANPTLLTPIQPKLHASKVSHFVPHCANEYVKEKKEKKTTIFTQYHGELIIYLYIYIY